MRIFVIERSGCRLPMGSHETVPEVEEGVCSPQGDGACADDWFFQATSHVSPDD